MYRSRITDGHGTVSRAEWMTRPSSSRTSAFSARTRHVARWADTTLSGSKLALRTSALRMAGPYRRASGGAAWDWRPMHSARDRPARDRGWRPRSATALTPCRLVPRPCTIAGSSPHREVPACALRRRTGSASESRGSQVPAAVAAGAASTTLSAPSARPDASLSSTGRDDAAPTGTVRRTPSRKPIHEGRGSFGRPSIISPMMLRWICDDPA